MIKFTGNINNTLTSATQYNSQFTVAPYATTTYTVKAANDETKTANCVINVSQPVTGISFAGPASITRNLPQQYVATVTPAGADNNKVSWGLSIPNASITNVSSDTLTATVTGNVVGEPIGGVSYVTLAVTSQAVTSVKYSKTIAIHDYVTSFYIPGYTNNGTVDIDYDKSIDLLPTVKRESNVIETMFYDLIIYSYQITSGSSYLKVQQDKNTEGYGALRMVVLHTLRRFFRPIPYKTDNYSLLLPCDYSTA